MGQALTLGGQLDAIRGGQDALNLSSRGIDRTSSIIRGASENIGKTFGIIDQSSAGIDRASAGIDVSSRGIDQTSAAIRGALPAIDAAAAASQRGTDIQIGATQLKAQEEANAYDFERKQYKTQEQTIRTAAAQAEAKRTRDFVSSMETIQAIQAGRGVGLASPTNRAVIADLREDTRRDIGIERSDYATKASQSALLAERAGEKGRYSLLAGEYGVSAAQAEGAGRQAGFNVQRADIAQRLSENEIRKYENEIRKYENEVRKTENEVRKVDVRGRLFENEMRLSENELRKIENEFRRSELSSKKTSAKAGAIDSTLNLFGKFFGR